ncbi:MAG: DNA polymerase III subunit delta [Clostridia bacterium]
MNHTDFFKSIKSEVKRVYFLHGNEEFIKDAAFLALKQTLDESTRDINLTTLSTVTADELIGACDVSPFFGDMRMIVAKSIPSEDDGKKIGNYLNKIPDTTMLVFLIRGVADAKKGLVKKLKNINAEFLFDTLTEREASKWIVQHSAMARCSISAEDALFMLSLVGRDMGTINNELSKLTAYVKSGLITRETILKIVTRNIESRVFALLDYCLANKVGEGLRSLDILIKDGEKPLSIAAFIQSRLELMLKARECIDLGLKTDEAKLRIGGHPYAAEQALKTAKRIDKTKLTTAILDFSNISYLQVSGKMKDRDALESAIIKNFAI